MADDKRLPRAEKKSLSDALPGILEHGRTSHPMLTQIALARMINQSSGGAVIAPWETDELPDDWLDAFRFSMDDLQAAADVSKKISTVKNAWLARHPTYGK